MTTHPKRRFALSLSAVLGLILAGVSPAFADARPASTVSAAPASPTASPRPQYHYTPAQHWMNDPNGLIYTGGKYHLFYQYNPLGDTAGNGSWGHAVSTDLTHWTELPVAIPQDATEDVWSGSVVNDTSNTSGLGTGGAGPLVAIYTSDVRATGVQRQSIAYSNDGGTTWTKYAGNPVLDIGSHNFRDPKVFWYAPARQWRMIVALSDQHKAAIYGSGDLKNWTELSEFGPDGVTSAVWECPDLFPMQLDGNGPTKWVLTVNVAGKAEYFVGWFDGTTFTDSEGAYVPPAGTVLSDFEGSAYDPGWTTTGTAFGTGPAQNTGATGAVGSGYIDTFHGSDAETGTLTSPTFTIDKGYLNLLIAGGNHPYVPGGSVAPPAGDVFQDFEGYSLPGWTGTGDFANIAPSHETLSGQVGGGVLDTWGPQGDPSTGTITSPTFTVTHPYVDLLTAGGNHPWGQPSPTSVNLVVNGQVVDSVTGNGTPNMDWVHLDASKYLGQQATIQIVDDSTGATGWGHFMVDEIVFSDAIAQPWNTETGVNLLVGGQVVRTATGNDSGGMDWTSWDVRDLQGEQAQLQFVDLNTGGWGHVIADEPTLADAPAQSAVQRAHWLDSGHDYYAAVTYNDAPKGQRIQIGWVDNWDYANTIPTSPWRGQQSVPRLLSLQTVDGQPRIVQSVVQGVDALAVDKTVTAATPGPITGTQDLGTATSTGSARIDATLAAGTATTFGLQLLRSADGTQNVSLQYDTRTGTLSLDRTHSGNTAFDPAFPVVDTAVVPLDKGRLTLRIYVDTDSIEVFAQGGRAAMTQLVFPAPGSAGIAATATGGTAQLARMTVTPLGAATAG